jgi:hypothetical protein
LSELDSFFESFSSNNSTNSNGSPDEAEMLRQIRSISSQKRQNLADEGFDVFNYYQIKMIKSTEFVSLAETVFAAPSCQVSVERSFSALALLLQCNRASMKDSTIDDIMVCNLNSDLFYAIDFENLK